MRDHSMQPICQPRDQSGRKEGKTDPRELMTTGKSNTDPGERQEGRAMNVIPQGLITVIKRGIVKPAIAEAAMISADLGTQLESFVTKLVETGRYNSKSEVLREGIRLIQEREARLAVLDQALARGLADADSGRVKPAGDVFAQLEAKYQAMGTPAK